MALFGVFAAALLFAPLQDPASDSVKALDAGQPAVAESLLRQAVRASPGDVSARFNLAVALGMQQKDTEAIAELRKTLELQPHLYEAELNLAVLLLRNQRAAEAVPLLTNTLAFAAPSPQKAARAHLYLGQALLQTGDPAGGERHLREAASLDPAYKESPLEAAAAYEKAGMLPQALALYRQFPENPEAGARLARLQVESGEPSKAIPALEEAVRKTPSVANRLALADAYKLNKQRDRAVDQLRQALAADPSNYDVNMFLGRELRDMRKLPAAAEQFSAAAKLRPDSVQAWNELATVLIVGEDYADGLAALDRVRALGKEIPGDFYYRAIALERLNQKKPAVEAYRQFLASDGGKMPDQEFLARQRVRIIQNELNRK